MLESSWYTLSGVDLPALMEARLQTHFAAQWLARTARAFIPAQPYDDHTNLGWNNAIGGLETHPLSDGSRLGLVVADLALVFSGPDGSVAGPPWSLVYKNEVQARAWLREQFTARGFDSDALDHESPYAMPAHAIAAGARYGGPELGPALAELTGWFANADLALANAREQIASMGLPAPAVRCWPHHFDLATLTSFPAQAAGKTAFVGVGFSPGDHYYAEPYFYVSLYPAVDIASLPAFPGVGHWHGHEFIAAIATASEIEGAQDQQEAVSKFLEFAVDTSISRLRGG